VASDEAGIHRIAADELTGTVRSIFLAAGCDEVEATRVATDLVAANLTGHDSHGVVRVPLYVSLLRQGLVHAGRSAEVVTDGGAFLVVDGRGGLGQTVGTQAVEWGIERARELGTCIVALRDAVHIGRVGRYAEMAIAAGLISIHFVNVARSPMVAPFGAVERRFSTAPIAIGVPLPEHPVVLDFATSLVAEGKVQVASQGGRPLPPDALISADGQRSADPHVLYGDYGPEDLRSAVNGTGAIRAFGEHKGSGLALVCELLGGAFTGGDTAGPPGERRGIANGMLSIYLSPEHFGTRDEFVATGREYLDWVLSARPERADAPVLAPGDPEAANRAARTAGGVPLAAGTWAAILRTAAELGVPTAGADRG
jgi:uncharacterized oxidoreductase